MTTRLNRLFFPLLLACSICGAGDLPDPHITPGATNPEVTQDNIQSTVCVKGFTKTIRPPAYYTNRLKKQQLEQYGYADQDQKHYEEDHLIALSIGGSPRDPKNLWPQPRKSQWSAQENDALEIVLYKMVCRGELPLAQAQHEMATDWIKAYKAYYPSTGERLRASGSIRNAAAAITANC